MNATDLLCMQEFRQTRDRTNGHLVDSNTLLIELSSPSVKSVVYVEADLRLMNLAFHPTFYGSLNTVVIMQKMNQKVFILSNNAKDRY